MAQTAEPSRAKLWQHYLLFSFFADQKYSRFLWSVQTSKPCSAPSRKCLHSSMAQIMVSISLSWIS